MSSAHVPQSASAPRKNPLRVAKLPRGAGIPHDFARLTPVSARRSGRGGVTAAELREMSVSEFAAWLRTQTSKKTRRPYQGQTVTAYCDAAKALHRWMTAEKIDADFTACDTTTLNRFFADYRPATAETAPDRAWRLPASQARGSSATRPTTAKA
jgi:hypothetical protein